MQLLARQGIGALAAPQNVYLCRDEETWVRFLSKPISNGPTWCVRSASPLGPTRASWRLPKVGRRTIALVTSIWRVGWTQMQGTQWSSGLLRRAWRRWRIPAFVRASTVRRRKFFETPIPCAGTHPMQGMPFRFKSWNAGFECRPTLGQDTSVCWILAVKQQSSRHWSEVHHRHSTSRL